MARFSAAYALYEFGDPAALPALQEALDGESDASAREEMELAVGQLKKASKGGTAAPKTLNAEQLRDALGESLEENGLKIDQASAIAESADAASLPAILRLRDAAVAIDSKGAYRAVQTWRDVIKQVRRQITPGTPPPPVEVPEELSDDEVTRKFIKANIFLAREALKKGDHATARETLEDIIKSYPKHLATQEAVKLLKEAKMK